MLYIVTGSRGSMGGEVASAIERLERHAGAEVIRLQRGRGRPGTSTSRLRTAWQCAAPRLVTLRSRWTDQDSVFVVGWYLLPILVLAALRVLRRPRRLISIGIFMHDERLRRVVNRLLRALATDSLEFIVLSHGEAANLVEAVGIPPRHVHRIVFRSAREAAPAPSPRGDYVFTGGYTNRDYATFFTAVAPLPCDVIAVASRYNELPPPPSNVDLRIGTSQEEFEALLAGCDLLALPLRAGGEACGQTVVVSALRHRRPIVAARHESLVDYLGEDYPGFVPPHDAQALRAAIERALADERFRAVLGARVEAAARTLDALGDLEDDFVRILVGAT